MSRFSQNIKEEEEETVVEFLNYEVFEVVDEFEEVEQQNVNVPFVDTSYQFDEVLSEVKADIKPVIESSTIEIANVQTFDGHWSDEDKNDVDSDEEYSTTSKQSSRKISGKSKAFESRKHFWTHKLTSLQGKIGCKYCQTVFKTRDELTAHKCKYLKCDPKNFICRICKKELSRKTFSNHLHETLDCKFCGKKFVNPRNMKTHLKIQHDFTEKIIPLRENNVEDIKEVVKQEKIRKPRKKEKLECGKFGKIFMNCFAIVIFNYSRSLRQVLGFTSVDGLSHGHAYKSNKFYVRNVWRKVLHAQRHQES